MRVLSVFCLLGIVAFCAHGAVVSPPLLLNGLALNNDGVVIAHGGRLWRIPSQGGPAQSLTDGRNGEDANPSLSPDGEHVAFTRSAGGNEDVYTMPSSGGEARRATYHPKGDTVRGWTSDSQRIVFTTSRDGDGVTRLYTIAADGVWPEPVPVPYGRAAAFSPDDSHMAYNPVAWPNDTIHYRYYRGGMTSPLWILDLADSAVEVIEGNDSNHNDPKWVGDTIYYLGDRSGTFNLYAYDLNTRKTRQLTAYNDYGIRRYDASAFGIVFERAGRLFRFDANIETATEIEFTIELDAPELEPKRESATRWVSWARPSSDGAKIVYEARGDILLQDRESGEVSTVTSTSNAAERSPIFSPDDQNIAYFSDASGEYALHIHRLADGNVRIIEIEPVPSFYRQPTWSPDGRHIAFSGKRLALWIADVVAGTAESVSGARYLAHDTFRAVWSPDGRYLAYSRGQPNHNRRLVLVDVYDQHHATLTIDGFADSPAFDRSGRYLYYIGSDNAALGAANNIWGLLSAIQYGPFVTKTINAVVLRDDQPAPYFPSNDRPHPKAQLDVPDSRPIDFYDSRWPTLRLPLPSHDYTSLWTGATGELHVSRNAWPETPGASGGPISKLARIDLTERPQLIDIEDGIDDGATSLGGKLLVFGAGSAYKTLATGETEANRLTLGSTQMNVNPQEEWRQMYREAWRLMRDYFYDHNHHGQDLQALEAHYAAYLPGITRRSDLNDLFRDMLGEISISHMSIGGGDTARPSGRTPRAGDLGAEFTIDKNRYKITKIYRRGNAQAPNGFHRGAPLDQPAMDIREGDYIQSIDGQPVDASRNLYEYLEGTIGKDVELIVAANSSGDDARSYRVAPLAGANGLKRGHWFEENRLRVHELSKGRLQYVPISSYSIDNINAFIGAVISGSYGKDGYVIDQRFNGGGITSDFLVQLLTRDRYHHYRFPRGEDLTVPTAVPRGSTVVLINENNFSAAETFPLMTQIAGAGILVGKRTGGGGTGGALHYPSLIDGGRITIPNRASYNWKTGKWAENDGVHPDIEVEWWPKDWREGRDPQLERAVEIALQAAENVPDETVHKPEPMRHPR